MNRLQKIAKFQLKVIAVSVIAGIIIGLVLAIGGNKVVAIAGGGLILAIGALLANLSYFFIRKKKGKVNYDERDASIEKRSHMVGYACLWCIFIIVCMIPIPPFLMPLVLAVTLASIKSIESCVILANYGWRTKENE
jgi:hypothetical protein